MRRMFTMLLVLSMVLSMAMGVSAAETGTDIASALVLEVTQGNGGATVNVYLEGCDGVTNGRFSVGYDASVLTLAQVQTADAYAYGSVNDEAEGSVYLAWVGSELTAEKTLMLTLILESSGPITQSMTYSAASEGIFAGTEAVEADDASVTIAYAGAVDFTALEQAVAAAEALNGEEYTEESFAAVEDALTAGIAVLADADATQEEVDAAAKALTDAMAALVKLGDADDLDTEALEAAIGKAESLDAADYTEESYAHLLTALAEAKAVLENGNATQEEVDAAAKALREAIANLESPETGDSFSPVLVICVMAICVVAIVVLIVLIRKGKGKEVCRCFAMILVCAMALSLLPAGVFAADSADGIIRDSQGNAVGTVEQLVNTNADLKLDQQLAAQLAPYDDRELVRIIVELEGDCLLERGYTQNQITANTAAVSGDTQKLMKLQENITQRIASIVEKSGLLPENAEKTEAKYNFTVALNGIAMTVPYGTLEKIRQLDGVAGAYVATEYTAAQTEASDSPNMYSTSQIFGAAQTWQELGYTGEGMLIAIVDTGLDLDHPSFADAPAGASLTESDIAAVLTELNAYDLYSQTSALALTADKLYRSEKVPYGFNYVDCGLDVTHDYDEQGDHGTHVAGISAANKLDTTNVVGVAPDAQLVVMKVFGQNGGAFGDDIMAAIEDSILLGVDVINMSLGSPAGFTEDSVLINEVYGRLLQTDILLSVACGNTNSAAYGNSLGTNLNYTSDPDNGLVNSPSTYLASTSVASVENTTLMAPYFTVGENRIGYADVTYKFYKLGTEDQEYVMVPGYGRAEDYAGVDVNGKIAVVSRGGGDDVTFVVKQKNAFANGAIALIVYNNVDGDLIAMYDEGLLPNVFISRADGALMAEYAGEDGVGILNIMPPELETAIPSAVAGQLSDFSCWGVTPDLQLSPDVTAPGGNIYSCYMDGKYGTMSGTSMAAPHIAGMSALVLQHLHEVYPDLTDAQYHTIAEALVMCTAEPILDPDGILYSPRKQGAGSANVYSAITSSVYLTSLQSATGELTPKASLGDDPDRTGVFSFCFDMHNLSAEDQAFVLEGLTLTDQFVEIDGKEYMGETGRDLTADVTFQVLNATVYPEYDANRDGQTDMNDVQFMLDVVNGLETLDERLREKLDLWADGVLNTVDVQLLYELLLETYEAQTQVVVPANSSITVQVRIALSDADKAYMEAHYENGIYVEGFVRAYAQKEDSVDLSLPFMGFYGDWHDAPMFDTGWYYQDEETLEYNRYLNVIFATLGAEGSYGGLGINPYILEDYDFEHNVLSPNGDGYYDYVPEIYISMMRSAELLDFTWTDDATGEQLFYEYYAYARKSYYWAAYGQSMPLVYTDGGLLPFTFYDENGNLTVEDLQHMTLTIRGYLDDGDLDGVAVDENGNPLPDIAWADATVEIPVVIDLAKPKLNVSSIVYSTEDGRNYITFDVEDNYDIAAVVALTNGGDAYEYIPVNEKVPGVDGEKTTIKLDITDYDATFQLVVCDYGCNESYYQITNPGSGGMSEDRFYAFRQHSSPSYGGTMYSTDELNGWYSFESADEMMMHTSQQSSGEATVYAAEYIDGYVIGAQDGGRNGANNLFIMKAGSWERTGLGSTNGLNQIVYQWPGSTKSYFPLNMIALDMAYDYTSDTLYLLANALENDYFPEGVENLLLKVDYLTGDYQILGIIEGAEGELFTALTLACDNDGVLYTVNYENGMLYTIDVDNAESAYGADVTEITNPMNRYMATNVSTAEPTYYPASYTQSMTVDHETNKLYWAAYQSRVGTAYFFEVDKDTGALLSITPIQDNSEMTGLFKPYDSGRDIIPEAQLEGLALNTYDLYMSVGDNATVTVSAVPFYAQLGDITWSSADESIATVSPYGIVEAVGVGTTTVTASCGSYTAECAVNVAAAGGTLYAFSGENWLLMDASQPYYAVQVMDAMALEGEVRAAAYMQGYLYAAAVETGYDADYNEVYTTNLYKLDPNTLSGTLLGSYDGNTTALAVNYADGFLYGITMNIDTENWNYNYDLVRVNIKTGRSVVTASLNSLFNNLEKYEESSGALAIDYQGNFYVSGTALTDPEQFAYSNVLIRFNLDENAEIANVLTYTGLVDDSNTGDAMVWSESNGGIIRAYCDPDSQEFILSWLDVSDMENVTKIDLGTIRSSVYPGVFALAMPISQEPEMPTVLPTSITLEESYSVPAGETIRIAPNVEPWNANAEYTFQIGDPAIATVDEYGVVTGQAIGQTTLTVSIPGTELSATTVIDVTKNPGYLYGFFQADIVGGYPLEYWGKIGLSNPSNSTVMSDVYDFTVYAAAYYDGYVYACAQSSYDGLHYTLKISPTNFAYDVLSVCSLTVRDMAFDYTAGTMYAVGYDENTTGGLYQMNLKTGEMTLVGDNDLGARLVALAVDNKGVIYAADDYGELMILDKQTAQITSTGIYSGYSQYLQSMVYDYNNDALYWAKGGTLYQVDLLNKELEDLGCVDVYGGESSVGCIISGLFSVPQDSIKLPKMVPPSGVVMDEKNTVAVGDTLQVEAVVLPISVCIVNQTLTWSSGDTSIATVDENGVVTGVSAGEVYITATDIMGNSGSILITVTAEQRSLYGYDEISRSWKQFDFSGKLLNTWADEEGLSPIVAAQQVGQTLYAYDADGYYYSIDTETFQRTKLGNGIHGLTTDLTGEDKENGVYYVEDIQYQVIDMTYAQSRGGYVGYAVMMAYNVSAWRDSFSYKIAKINLNTGAIISVIAEDALCDGMSLRPTNLIYSNGYLYTVNGYITGMMTKIDPLDGTMTGIAIFADYWGDFNGGRSFLEDPLTGEIYAIRDLRTQYIGQADYDDSKASSVLVRVGIGVAYAEEVCELGAGLRITGLFIQ